MPNITFDERGNRQGTQGDQNTSKRTYLAQGSDDEAVIRSEAYAQLPAWIGDRALYTIEVEEADTHDGDWYVTANYKSPDGEIPPPGGGGGSDAAFSFNTSGGTQHITQSRGTNIYTYSAGEGGGTASAQDHQIGLNGDSVDGVDIIAPIFDFDVTRYLDPATVTAAYFRTLFTLTGKVNNAAITLDAEGTSITFERGELLFKGANGSKRRGGMWEMNYQFSALPNTDDALPSLSLYLFSSVPPEMAPPQNVPIYKRGWQYLWVEYQDQINEETKRIYKAPVAAYVEDVYEEADFSALQG
jgi:hypothetical protein